MWSMLYPSGGLRWLIYFGNPIDPMPGQSGQTRFEKGNIMKDTTHSHRKMVLLTLASVALLTASVQAQTVSAQQDDLILGFRATGGTGAGVNLEINLGSVSNFYNG